jgi:CubicO group peptidase (beta-lactamase class C family)
MNGTISSRLAVASVTLVILTGSYCLSQTSPEDVATRIDDYLSRLVATDQLSGSVLVADDGEILISKGYGLANIEHDVPNTPHTKFRIGSITKQFTAMAIMMLQEQELLSVHDPISAYVLDCPEAWKDITIHHLLTHTSGIPEYVEFSDIWEFLGLPRTIEDTIAYFKESPLDFSPGTRHQYSNSGYVVLGYIIEAVTGEPYEVFLSQNIFEPLGMSNSGYDNYRTILLDRAAGYTREGGILMNGVHIETGALNASGALYSTVEDLFLWDQALYTTELVSEETLNTIFTAHVPIEEGPNFYGYGWTVGPLHNRASVRHSGRVESFHSRIFRYPEEGVCIILLFNFFDITPMKEVFQTLGDIVKDIFDPMLMVHWKLDEAEGMTAFDSSGDHHAQVKGGATWQPQGGVVDGALDFDGVTSFVVTDSPVNPSESHFSIFAWVKGGDPGQAIVSQQGNSNWLMAEASQGALVTQLRSGGRSASNLSSSATITDADWHRVGFTWDGFKRTLYVDGVAVAEDTQDSLEGSDSGLYIGCGKGTESGTFWSGLIDDVRIYDRAVTP